MKTVKGDFTSDHVPTPIPGLGANLRQVGGDHYNKGSKVQHWDFVVGHNIGYLEGVATKYPVRWRSKNGVQDLEKTKHYIEKLVEKAMAGYRPTSTATTREVEAWCLDNGVDLIESLIIRDLFTWQPNGTKEGPIPSKLEAALQFIDVLIYKAKTEAEAIKPTEEERKELHRSFYGDSVATDRPFVEAGGFMLGTDDGGPVVDVSMPKFFSETLHPGVTAVAYKGARVQVKGHHPEVRGKEGHVQDIYDKGLWLLIKFDDPTIYPHGYQCQYGDLVLLDALAPQPLKA